MYQERPSGFDGAVLWTNTAAVGESRVLPDGCMDLIWGDGVLLVAGPDTTAHVATHSGPYTGLRFFPGTAPAVLGVPAHELRDRRVPLEDLWPAARARRAVDCVAHAHQTGRALEQIAAERVRAQAPSTAMTTVARALQAGSSVAGIADAVGLSARQLHRRSLDAFGYGPKVLARVLRMNRALALARAGVPFAETAHRVGYADQSHLAREVKGFAGVPLSALAESAVSQ